MIGITFFIGEEEPPEAEATEDPRSPRKRGGRRIKLHRARSIWSAIGLTTLCAFLPGSGFVVAGRRFLGLLLVLPHLVVAAVGLWWVTRHTRDFIGWVVDTDALLIVSSVLMALLVVWVVVLVSTYRMLRPEEPVRWQRAVGGAWVVVLCLVLAAPLAMGARYAMAQRDFVNAVFSDDKSATRPEANAADPWGGDDRVNVLLLGGDGGIDREGIRTDSLILASTDTASGDTVLFSVPRNLQHVPFPEDSPLAELYPDGFGSDGEDLEGMINAVYRNVPAQHPGVLGESDNEGADALKLAMSGVLGVDVDYYMLINLAGFEEVVDAMGGITVNINEPIPIGGDSDRGIPPEDYLDPGPDQHLDGFEALWFARGRYGYDDYHRMDRQRCVIDAIIDEANPVNLLRRYQALLEAGKKIVRTDFPQDLLPAFAQLSMDIKDANVRSVVFRSSEKFQPGDPDYEWVHESVQRAIGEADHDEPKTQRAEKSPAPDSTDSDDTGEDESAEDEDADDLSEEPADTCAYDPAE